MNILDKIIAHKKKEVEQRKAVISVKELERSTQFSAPCFSLKKALLDRTKEGIIAEFKRRSPSKGIINENAQIEATTFGYLEAGASAVSILTDYEFFGGTIDDIKNVVRVKDCPILRKDFIIDEYQIVEAKSIGADVILLLANVLTSHEVKQFSTTAKFLGLEILLEIRNKEELDAVNVLVDCVGVNNRNLKDFKVDVKQSFELSKLIPEGVIKISESGIDSAGTIHELRQVGFQGFLIGETFMKEKDPGQACAKLIREIKECKV